MSENIFVQDLETVVYGCHSESQETVRAIFDEHGIYTFFFSEYFLDEPVRETGELDNRRVYFPFLQRAVMELKFTVESKNTFTSTEFEAKTRKWLAEVRQISRIGTKLSDWESHEKRISTFLNVGRWADEESIWTSNHFIKLQRECKDKQRKLSYDIQAHLWARHSLSRSNPLRVLRLRIASKETYYGQLMIVFRAEESVATEICSALKNVIGKVVQERYVPTLVLLHVSKWERELRTALKNGNRLPKPSPIHLDWAKSSNEFECAFGMLWRNRKDCLRFKRCSRKQILDGIILDKYHIASPAMVKQVREVIRGTKLMKAPEKRGESLPSALVFGEAGSGKDQMARLIPTLTPDYLTAPVTTQNMAAVKPALMAVPLMFGTKLPKGYSLPGLFSSTNGAKQVFILDELNSLDYDMQGSLLRLLENSEAAAMFSSGQPQFINALVIGIVNEDPDEVTRESELRLLKAAEEFLGKAEAARLYDALHRSRRLRPDLVYRLKRGVYVRVPALRHRREDIPLLFKHPCTTHLENLFAHRYGQVHERKPLCVEVEYDLDVYDLLMRRDLHWPGNLRQLQAVSRRAADEVWLWHEKRPALMRRPRQGTRPKNGRQEVVYKTRIEVRRAQVVKVLGDQFPEQIKNTEDGSD